MTFHSFWKKKGDLIVLGLFFAIFLWFFVSPAPSEYLNSFIGENYALSAGAFVLLMFSTIVVAPVTIPLGVPAAALFFGPAQAALLAVFGWSLGSVAAFFIARRFGRRLLSRVMDLQKLDRFEKLIPGEESFWWMLLFRMMIPVDILSYGLGLFPHIRFVPYLLATVIGIMPFSFIFAYMGDAMLLKDYGRVVGLAILGCLILLMGVLFFRIHLKTKKPEAAGGGRD